MTVRLFLKVMLANCLVIICFNLLMLLPELKMYLLAPSRRILIGLCLYGFQFFMTANLLKTEKSWLTLPFKGKFIIQGIFAFAIVIILSIILVSFLDEDSQFKSDQGQWGSFLMIFVLNSLPGALMEEWLFRYFPVRFVQSESLKLPANVIYISILLLFTLIHIPAYLFQYDSNLSSLGNIFVSGIFLFLIFILTRNVIFTALFHAFGNNPKFIINSDVNWQYFYASVFLVTLAYPLVKEKMAQRAARKQDYT